MKGLRSYSHYLSMSSVIQIFCMLFMLSCSSYPSSFKRSLCGVLVCQETMMTKPVTESLEPYTFVYEDRGPSCNNAQPRSTKGLKKATTATTIQQQDGAALREPVRCLWLTGSAGPCLFLLGRCSTRCTGCCFCVAGSRPPRDRAPFGVAGAGLRALGAASGQRPPRDRAPFCVARVLPVVNGLCRTAHLCVAGTSSRQRRDRAPFGVEGAALERLGAAFDQQFAIPRSFCAAGVLPWQRPPRDRVLFVAGAALGAPNAAFAWQLQPSEPRRCLWLPASA